MNALFSKLLAIPIVLTAMLTPANLGSTQTKPAPKPAQADTINSWLTRYEVIIMISLSLGGTIGGVIVFIVRGTMADKAELKQRRLSDQILEKVEELLEERFSPQLDALDRQVTRLIIESRDNEELADKLQSSLSKLEVDVGLMKHTRDDLLMAIDAQMAAADSQLTAILASSFGCDTNIALYRPTFRRAINDVLAQSDRDTGLDDTHS